ncbi:MAG: glycine cleavage system protein H [Candidatus Melainabacteria bacterium HGW-Melainabacteria-1]|nr:MAG: glycine cleavage system protein H [Candidatus Melainabacteria bacterium HGW-Melainabacteria-1]
MNNARIGPKCRAVFIFRLVGLGIKYSDSDGLDIFRNSDFAQDQLGEVVYVDLPAVGDEIVAGENFGEIESVKSVSELISPVSGEVVEVNDALGDTPETVNEDPYGDGWMIKIKMGDPAQVDDLMTADEYEAFVAEEA